MSLVSRGITVLSKRRRPSTPSGIEPSTFRLVTQCLNEPRNPCIRRYTLSTFQLPWKIKNGTKGVREATINESGEENTLKTDAKRITAVGAKPGGTDRATPRLLFVHYQG